MENNFNLSSLKTIQTPLLELLQVSHSNIKKNIEIYTEEKRLPTDYEAIQNIQKVEKLLSVIGLAGISTILSLNKEAVIKVKEISFDTETHIKILKLVEKNLGNVIAHIKQILSGAPNKPTKFYEDYKNLAALIKVDTSIEDLFNPKLELRHDLPEIIQEELRRGVILNKKNKKSLADSLKILDSIYLTKMLDIKKMLSNDGKFETKLEKERYEQSCNIIYEKFDAIQKLKISKSHYIFFGLLKLYMYIISPEHNKKFDEYVKENKESIAIMLGDIKDVILSLLMQVNEALEESKSGNFKVKESIAKNVLFTILNAINKDPSVSSMSTAYTELNTYFDLEDYAEQLIDTNIKDTTKNVNADYIEKCFIDLKEEFIIMTSKKKANPENFKQSITKITSLSSKIMENIIPVKEVHVLLAQFTVIVSKIKSENIKISEAIEKELALALVLIEYGVNNLIRGNVENKYRLDFGSQAQVQLARMKKAEEEDFNALKDMPIPKLDKLSRKNDEKKTVSKIFDQIYSNIAFVEESIDSIITEKEEAFLSLDKSIALLKEIKGVFAVVDQNGMSKVVVSLIDFWSDVRIQNSLKNISKEKLNISVEIISGLSLYVKSLRDENEEEAQILVDDILKKYEAQMNLKNEINIDNQEQIKISEVEDENVFKGGWLDVPDIESYTLEKPVEEITEISILKNEKEVNLENIESPNDDEVGEIFKEEARSVLKQLDILLEKLDNSEHDVLVDIRRYFHTLKGSGKMIGLQGWGESAWMCEQTINRVLNKELILNDKIISAINEMSGNFKIWLESLENKGYINIDLNEIKDIWEPLNDKLTLDEEFLNGLTEISIVDDLNSDVVEVPMVVEMDMHLDMPTVASVEEDFFIEVDSNKKLAQLGEIKIENESITIGGEEIALHLYNLYKEESVIHIEALKTFVNQNYGDNIELNADFMRHSHTLNSISKTVNLLKISKVASILEDISFSVIEKDIKLNNNEMKIIRHAVERLEDFQDILNQEDDIDHEMLVNDLSTLCEDINNREMTVEETTDLMFLETKSVDKEEVRKVLENSQSEETNLELEESNKLEQLSHGSLNEVDNRIKLLLEEKNKFIDKIFKDLAETIKSKNEEKVLEFKQYFEKQNYEKVQSVLDDLSKCKASYQQKEADLTQLMKKFETKYEIKEKELNKLYKEKIEDLSQQIEILKKKNNQGFLARLFGKNKGD